ncbi:RNA polymerase sigma factor [Stieleria marina]|uniref:RNA polymerase sigma factor n=1 Tax=Stieleria marina TaxID=1930275 RepID=A0A517NXL9_9BACT|nr:RNA polymerase sigma factor [Planctomycetes bacterium K23_9]
MIEPAVLASLFNEHADRLLLVARSMGEPAEDAVQEAFVALATQAIVPAEPMAWLVAVVRNHLRQSYRSNGRRQQREFRLPVMNWFQSTPQIDTKIDGQTVSAALQRCPSPDREIVVMHLWGEMTFQSIGEIVGMSRAKAHRVFQKQIGQLQEQFNPVSVEQIDTQVSAVRNFPASND